MNYVSTFDVACLTETFADSTFDFSGLFTENEKCIAPAKNKQTNKTKNFLNKADGRVEFYF